MCVIIIIPETERINEEELNEAWTTNPDGAGYAIQTPAGVEFQRGYMNRKHYINQVMALQERPERGALMLHLRISTGAGITPQGTHPYKAGNVLKLQGKTRQPVICMNGVIYCQPLRSKRGEALNDTASYIKDHTDAFKNINADILDIVSSDTGAKWCALTPDAVYMSGGFTEHDGLYYSNQNHINHWNAWNWCTSKTSNERRDYLKPNYKVSDFIRHPKTRRDLKKDKSLYNYVEEFINTECATFSCTACADCITDAQSGEELEDIITENYGRIEYLYLK